MTALAPPDRPARHAVAVLVAGCLALAGCSGGDGRGPSGDDGPLPVRSITITPTPGPRGIFTSFIQQRFDEGTDRAQVRIVNNTPRTLRVRRVGLVWPGYDGGLQRAGTVVAPGATLDIRYLLPAPRCDVDAAAVRPIGVFTTPAGRVRRTMTDDGLRFLARIWQGSCDLERVRRTVRVAWGERWRDHTGPRLVGALELQRSSGRERVTVEGLQGSVLFDLHLAGERTLLPGARRAALPVVVTPGRCDEHARSQSMQTFTFRLWVRVGRRPPAVVVVSPGRPVQTRWLAFLDRACEAA